MKTRTNAVATLAPGATKMVQRLIRHLDGDPNAGAYITLGRSTDKATEVDAFGYNVSRFTVLSGAKLACLDSIEQLRQCSCGRDHANEIAVIERVVTLLAGEAETIQ